MNHSEVLEFIDAQRGRHLSNKVLHAHPSPAFWSDDGDRSALNASWSSQQQQPAKVNLYLSIPFCLPTTPAHCGFCLFPTEPYQGQTSISSYLDHLEKEADIFSEYYRSSELESVYVGGGTPNLLKPADYERLAKIVERIFPSHSSGLEKTLEGIPQLFNKDKIKAIQAAGFNRISIGVQQLNEDLIRYSGRKQTNKHVFDALQCCQEHALPCNVDLIYGWPEQTIQDMINGLRTICRSGVGHLTHYELNIAGRSNFSKNQREKIPDVEQRLHMYQEACAFLRSEGFVQRTVYDWERPASIDSRTGLDGFDYQYERNLRNGLDPDQPGARRYMTGLGHAAVNVRAHAGAPSTPSVSTMNYRSLPKYVKAVQQGQPPIERFYVHNQEDIRLLWLFQSLQEMSVDTTKYHKGFGRSFTEDFAAIVDVLNDLGWATFDGRHWNTSELGSFYTPLIQALLSHRRVEALKLASNHRRTVRIHPVPYTPDMP